jgi:hypothetical protein
VLQQEVEMYDTYQRRIAECDQQLQKHLASFADPVPPQPHHCEGPDNPQVRALHCTYLLSADKSCLLFQMIGVETYLLLPNDQSDRGNLPRQGQARHRGLPSLGQ